MFDQENTFPAENSGFQTNHDIVDDSDPVTQFTRMHSNNSFKTEPNSGSKEFSDDRDQTVQKERAAMMRKSSQAGHGGGFMANLFGSGSSYDPTGRSNNSKAIKAMAKSGPGSERPEYTGSEHTAVGHTDWRGNRNRPGYKRTKETQSGFFHNMAG